MQSIRFDISKSTKRVSKTALTLGLALALSTSHTVFAKSLKPVKDVQTENEVIRLYNQALKYSKGERNVHARVVLEKAATYDPTSVSAYIHAALSEIYHDLGNPDRAIHEGLLALRYDRSMKDMYFNLGLFCKDANRYAEGIQYLTKFVEISSGEKKTTALSLIESLSREQAKMGSFSNNDPDYLGQLMAEGNAHYWPASRIPLRVYIEPSSGARGFRPEFVEIARNAFITWYSASGKKLSFNFVNDLNDADINVEWTDGTLKVGDEKYERTKAGLTTTTRREDAIEKSRIQIRTVRAFSKDPEPTDRIKETCLHEIGHALGLNGHSTSTADIMYFGNSARQLPALTKRDKATMARLYSAFPPYPMIGVDTSFPYPPPATDVPRLTGGDMNGGAGGGEQMGAIQPIYRETTLQEIPAGGNASQPTESAESGDEHLSIPADEAEAETDPGTPLPPTPAEQAASAGGGFNAQIQAPANSSPLPNWSAPGANSGMPVQSWQNPAANQAPQGVAWPGQNATNWSQQSGPAGGSTPTYASPPPMPYATTPAQYAAPTGWQPPPTQYYQQNQFAGSQPMAQPGSFPIQNSMQASGTGGVQQNALQPSGVGPEQVPAATQQNPIMQFAQQFFPKNNGPTPPTNQPNQLMQFAQQMFQPKPQQPGATTAPQPTPGQVVDQVLQMFNPQQQQPPPPQ
jgi:predicted Zn-dependent protease